MDKILFMNPWEGMSFMLKRAMKENEINIPFMDFKAHKDEFKKYNIKSCPILLIFDGGIEVQRLSSIEEIVTILKGDSSLLNQTTP